MEARTSAVDSPTRARPHVALATSDLEAAVRFYETLFMRAPTKARHDYAKFEVPDPSINLSLNLAPKSQPAPFPAHFGIQVKSTDDVMATRLRMKEAGFGARDEEQVTCCYAVQDKVWFDDPDGHAWEVFVVTNADAQVDSAASDGGIGQPSPDCCAPKCCE